MHLLLYYKGEKGCLASMPSVGEILRNARLRQGLSLAQVETQTRIRLKFLDALESDRFDEIPGKFFVRSFSLQYGAKLGVDAQELHAALDRQLRSAAPEAQSAPSEEKPITVPRLVADGVGPRRGDRRWVYSLAGLLAVLVLCSGVYMAWLRFSQGLPATEVTQVTPSPTLVSKPAPSPTPTPDTAPPIIPAQNTDVAAQAAGGKIAINISAKEATWRSEEHTSELQSPDHLVCRLLLEKKKKVITLKENIKVMRILTLHHL